MMWRALLIGTVGTALLYGAKALLKDKECGCD